MITSKNYTFYIATTPGKLQKLVIPAYVLHSLAVLALIGAVTVIAAVGSYSRMLWKVGNYNALRHDQETLKKQYQQLQSTVNDTNQRLDSLQSLATEVAMTYGVLRYHPAAFDSTDSQVTPEDAFDRSIEQYTFSEEERGSHCRLCQRHATDASDEFCRFLLYAIDLASDGAHHGQLRRTAGSVQR